MPNPNGRNRNPNLLQKYYNDLETERKRIAKAAISAKKILENKKPFEPYIFRNNFRDV